MIKKILITLLIIIISTVIILFTIAAFQPEDYKVARSITIKANDSIVWRGINLHSSFAQWNPWLKMDPNCKTNITGTDGTIGSRFSWDSKSDDLGSGEMTINKVVPMQTTGYDLHFIKPWDDHSQVEMRMLKQNDAMQVTWEMSGKQKLIGRAFMLLMGGFENAISKDFDKGLNELKLICETKGF